MASDRILTLDTQSMAQEVLNQRAYILVDFWAPWCGPCRMVAPVLEKIAEKLAGRLEIGKLNIDDFPDIAERYGVRSIPTMILFKAGQEVERIVGARGQADLEKLIEAKM